MDTAPLAPNRTDIESQITDEMAKEHIEKTSTFFCYMHEEYRAHVACVLIPAIGNAITAYATSNEGIRIAVFCLAEVLGSVPIVSKVHSLPIFAKLQPCWNEETMDRFSCPIFKKLLPLTIGALILNPMATFLLKA